MTSAVTATNSRPESRIPAGIPLRESWSEWLDRHSGTVFIAPAIIKMIEQGSFSSFG